MKRYLLALCVLLMSGNAMAECDAPLLDQTFRALNDDTQINLCDTYKDKVLLVVNTASRCGNTPQYEGLEKLYREYGEDGLVVLGFPSNDFGGQEPDSEDKVQEFCRLTYGVQFPMFEKISVKGSDAHPFYQKLAKLAGNQPGWNFHKFLIGRDGELITDFSAGTRPYDAKIVKSIETALAAEAS